MFENVKWEKNFNLSKKKYTDKYVIFLNFDELFFKLKWYMDI